MVSKYLILGLIITGLIITPNVFAEPKTKTLYIDALKGNLEYNGYVIFTVSYNGFNSGTIGESNDGSIKLLVPIEVTNSSISISCSSDNTNYSNPIDYSFTNKPYLKTSCILP